jgi:hypothetical protein
MRANGIEDFVRRNGDKGATLGDWLKLSGQKERAARQELKTLIASGALRGPFSAGRSQRYYVPGQEPSVAGTARKILAFLEEKGSCLQTKEQIRKAINVSPKDLDRALDQLRAEHQIAVFKLSKSTVLMAAKTASNLFSISPESHPGAPLAAPAAPQLTDLDRSRVWQAYEQLKQEQRGMTAVSIGKLMDRLQVDRDLLREFLLREAKLGRADLHPDTTTTLSEDEKLGAFKPLGSSELLVRVTLRR